MPHEFTQNLEAHRREAHGLTRLKESLRQVVFGANDGMITTFAVVCGFAGAQNEGVAAVGGIAVLIFGVANLFSDGVSMGLGEFLSSRSQAAVYYGERKREIEELQNHPEDEKREAYALLLARGVDEKDAKKMADLMSRNPDFMADFMMSYEFGLVDPEEDSAALNGFITFISFVIFGAIPLLPYFLRPADQTSFYLSIAMTLFAMASLGIIRWRATGEPRLYAISETVAVGVICALIAYFVGMLVGAIA